MGPLRHGAARRPRFVRLRGRTDRSSYTLRLHAALKDDYVLTGTIMTSPWQQLLASLEDEILRRSGRILKGYVDQWALQHAGAGPASRTCRRRPPRRRGASRLAAGFGATAARCCRAAAPAPTRTRPAPPRLHLHRAPSLRRLRGRRNSAVACGAGAAAPTPRSHDHHRRHPVTRRMIAVILATAVLALLLTAAAPRAEAMSFVDKQVQAGALLRSRSTSTTTGRTTASSILRSRWSRRAAGSPARRASGRRLLDTGRAMAPGTSRGTFTYTPSASGATYRFVVHLSSGDWLLGWRPHLVQTGAQHRVEAEPAAAPAVPRRLQGRPRRLPGDRVAHPGDVPEPDVRVAENP